jgi:hypothetical protein
MIRDDSVSVKTWRHRARTGAAFNFRAAPSRTSLASDSPAPPRDAARPLACAGPVPTISPTSGGFPRRGGTSGTCAPMADRRSSSADGVLRGLLKRPDGDLTRLSTRPGGDFLDLETRPDGGLAGLSNRPGWRFCNVANPTGIAPPSPRC